MGPVADADRVFAVWNTFAGTESRNDAGQFDYNDIGFDLDHSCTGEGQLDSCVEPPWASTISHHDGTRGIDNATGQAGAIYGIAETTLASANLAEPLFRVRQYSGEPDDDQVEVDLYFAFGLSPRPGGGVGPYFDGKDRWTILPESLAPQPDGSYDVDHPLFVDREAYVSGGVLVAQFSQAVWPSYLALAPWDLIPVRHLILSGRLVFTGRWELQDLVEASRIAVRDAIVRWGRWERNDGSGLPTCTLQAAFDLVKTTMCPYVDIASDTDSPTSPCDAFSSSLLLSTRPALLGTIAEPSPALPPCDPNVHPETDTCDSIAADGGVP